MKTNSAYSFGMLGYKTPTIDRIAKEGMTSARILGRSFRRRLHKNSSGGEH